MYGPEMDVWGAGCILFELTTLYPLFPGADEVDQINRIHRVLGTPSATVLSKLKKHASTQASFSFPQQNGFGLSKLLPNAKKDCLDLLTQSVAYDAAIRITSSQAMEHPYFTDGAPKFRSGKSNQVKESSHPGSLASPSFVSGPASTDTASTDQDATDKKPVPKTRSMVSILLARVRCVTFIIECLFSANSSSSLICK
jgi:serine/threonine protein kinase